MDKIIKNKLYPLQLWLTSVVFIAPLILIIKELIYDVGNSNSSFDLRLILLFIILGFALSSPTFLVTWLIYELLFRKVYSPLLIRVLTSIVSIAGVFITFYIISGSMAPELELIYSVSIIISSFLFKIKKVSDE